MLFICNIDDVLYDSGNLVEAGAAGHMFNRKGVIYVKQSEKTPLDQDKAEEIAIEVGAEEVVTGLDEEQRERLQVCFTQNVVRTMAMLAQSERDCRLVGCLLIEKREFVW